MLPLDEYELKFNVSGISLSWFQAQMTSLPDLREYVTGGGWDHYYARSSDSFWRLRVDPRFPELTKKNQDTWLERKAARA